MSVDLPRTSRPDTDKTTQNQKSNVSVNLAHDSAVQETHCGVHKVFLMADDGPQKLSLLMTILVPQAKMSFLSIPALNKKDIDKFFMPGFTVLYDLRNDFSILGLA